MNGIRAQRGASGRQSKGRLRLMLIACTSRAAHERARSDAACLPQSPWITIQQAVTITHGLASSLRPLSPRSFALHGHTHAVTYVSDFAPFSAPRTLPAARWAVWRTTPRGRTDMHAPHVSLARAAQRAPLSAEAGEAGHGLGKHVPKLGCVIVVGQ